MDKLIRHWPLVAIIAGLAVLYLILAILAGGSPEPFYRL